MECQGDLRKKEYENILEEMSRGCRLDRIVRVCRVGGGQTRRQADLAERGHLA
jgi:hypothetical protein